MRTSKPGVVVLLSGGIDSTALMGYYGALDVKLRPIFVDYGQPARRAELKSAQAVARYYHASLQKVSFRGAAIPEYGEITGRNAFLLSAALLTSGCEPALMALGIHAGTRYFDCGSKFVQLWHELLAGYTDGRVRLSLPFLVWSKGDVIRFCQERQVPIHLTWSCEASSVKPCRICASCKDREVLNARP